MSYSDTASYKLRQAAFLLDHLADRSLREHHGLTYSEFLVLLMVLTHGPAAQSSIAARLNVSRASITGRVRALVARGLLRVEQSSSDSRANTVTMTASGDALIRAAYEGLDRDLATLADGVDEEGLSAQLDIVIANCVRVVTAAETPTIHESTVTS